MQDIVTNTCGLIDLHLHLDGSLTVNTVRELAHLQGISVDDQDAELLKRLQVGPDCKDLNEYLEKFSFPCSLLQTKQALTIAVSNLLEELREQGLLYAEVRFAPQLHTLQGLTQTEVVEAAVAGLEGSSLKANLILCCMRGEENRAENMETVEVAAKFLDRGVCAVDLAGAEALFPTENFEDVFCRASELGVPFTIHAGEAAGPESVRTALRFGARRLGHGVRSAEDPELLRELAERGVALELCPTSNLNTGIFDSLEQYPIFQLLEAGVKATVNTDNITVSGVTLSSEWEKLIGTFVLNDEQIIRLLMNSVEATFASGEVKEWLKQQIYTRIMYLKSVN